MEPVAKPWRAWRAGLLATLLAAAGAQIAQAQDAVQEAAARNRIDYRRAQLGLAPLAHQARITTAARGHLGWLALNNQFGHVQDPVLPLGFSGETPPDRLNAAGYAGALSSAEVIAFGSGDAVEGVESLLQAIYHRFGIFMTSVDEQGVAFSGGHPGAGNVLVANFASRATPLPAPAPGWAGTYPFDGQAGVPIDFHSDEEAPDPVVSANRIGYPVSLQVQDFRDLSVQSFTLAPLAGPPVASILLSGSPGAAVRDAHTPASAAAILPLAPLEYGTTYTASFTGTTDGEPVTRTWSFTTAPAAITIAPSPVNVVPGQQVTLVLAGGAGRYLAQWSHGGITSPIGVAFAGFTQAIVSGLVPGQATLEIRDGDGNSATVQVLVSAGADTTPDPIEFPPRAGALPGATVVSHLVPVTGIDAPTAVSVASGEYSINGGPYTALPGTLQPGDWLGLRLAAPAGFNESASAQVFVGGVAGTFQVTTHASGASTHVPVLIAGWNLAGNGLNVALDALSTFGHAGQPLPGVSEKIESVWAWNAATRNWQFFSPLLTPEQTAAYAAAHGHEVLAQVGAGSGYWILAYGPAALPAQAGAAVTFGASAFNALAPGWNLIAIGAPVTPSTFNLLAGGPPLPSLLPANFESLWAWSPSLAKWLFYSPILEALPGGLANILAYAAQHGLLDFASHGVQLGHGIGFWVYRP